MNSRSIHMQDKKERNEEVVLLSADEEKAPPMVEVHLGKISFLEKLRYMIMVIVLMAVMGAGFYMVLQGPDQVLYSIREFSGQYK